MKARRVLLVVAFAAVLLTDLTLTALPVDGCGSVITPAGSAVPTQSPTSATLTGEDTTTVAQAVDHRCDSQLENRAVLAGGVLVVAGAAALAVVLAAAARQPEPELVERTINARARRRTRPRARTADRGQKARRGSR